jgi:hypothetical protein
VGQAKARGTFEQRQAEGELKRVAALKRAQEEHEAREAAMTPEQKLRRRNAIIVLGLASSIAGSASDMSLLRSTNLLRR